MATSVDLSDMPDEIMENLFLGDESQATNIALLKHMGITHVLTVQEKSETKVTYPNQEFVHKIVEVKDTPEQIISTHFAECIDFITSGRMRGKTLVHCFAGISRSATITIAYIMNTLRLTMDMAHDLVRKARSFIWPNAGFRKQLQAYEVQLNIVTRPKMMATAHPILSIPSSQIDSKIRKSTKVPPASSPRSKPTKSKANRNKLTSSGGGRFNVSALAFEIECIAPGTSPTRSITSSAQLNPLRRN
eukprot:TRINITY_DN464_c0_g1_i1.p1 TRINITY_DN464_c0_g1~~TRINITY_DN464_c0_g1_i1.p1  ORF type:complete len:247 (-),score=53.90 TRINITY_DN464_c0_g1_i1:223-963(-)